MPKGEGPLAPPDGNLFVPSPPHYPRLGLVGLILQLWRAKWLMLLVFLPVLALALLAAAALPQTYIATTRLLVEQSDGYGSLPSASFHLESVVESEIARLRSPVVATHALAKVTLQRAYPEIPAHCRQSECDRQAIAALSSGLSISSAPGSPVIVARFGHPDPTRAAEILNTLVETYIAERTNFLVDAPAPDAASSRESLEQNLSAIDAEIRAYLDAEGLSDFEAERQTLRALDQAARQALLQASARLLQVDGETASFRRQIAEIEPEQTLYVEDLSRQLLIDLQIEREEKLARYKPGSRVMRDLDNRIVQAEARLQSQPPLSGAVRRGPNPLYQQLDASLASLVAEGQSLRNQQIELRRQIESFEARQRELSGLEPGLRELIRHRDVVEQSLRTVATRELDGQANSWPPRPGPVNIRVLEPAFAPVEARSLAMPAVALSLMLAGLAALLSGLFRALTRPGFATPASLQRTLGLPVLVSVAQR